MLNQSCLQRPEGIPVADYQEPEVATASSYDELLRSREQDIETILAIRVSEVSDQDAVFSSGLGVKACRVCEWCAVADHRHPLAVRGRASERARARRVVRDDDFVSDTDGEALGEGDEATRPARCAGISKSEELGIQIVLVVHHSRPQQSTNHTDDEEGIRRIAEVHDVGTSCSPLTKRMQKNRCDARGVLDQMAESSGKLRLPKVADVHIAQRHRAGGVARKSRADDTHAVLRRAQRPGDIPHSRVVGEAHVLDHDQHLAGKVSQSPSWIALLSAHGRYPYSSAFASIRSHSAGSNDLI